MGKIKAETADRQAGRQSEDQNNICLVQLIPTFKAEKAFGNMTVRACAGRFQDF